MNTPEQNNRKLPEELDTEFQHLSSEDVKGLEEVWNLSEQPPSAFPNPEILSSIWATLERETEKVDPLPVAHPASDRPPVQKVHKARIIPLRWAAAAVVLIAVLAGGFFMTPVNVVAPYGETTSVHLTDGSIVELNSGSSLSYARRFGSQRTVRLKGEAYFDIVKEDRPFIVETFNSDVEVLGTTFNVKSWDEDAKTVVALETGRVRVTGRAGSGDEVMMEPGQAVRIEQNTITLSDPDNAFVSSAMSWRSGDFFFSEERLKAIVQDIERRFNTAITLAEASLGEKRTKYSHRNPESAHIVIEELCASLGLDYRLVEDGFEIFDPN